MALILPNKWDPRDYQLPLWNYMANGGRRAVGVWHRRAGKDSLSLNWTATDAAQNPGLYWHMLPTQSQARKVVWNAIDKKGRRVIDQVFPHSIRDRTSQQEMLIGLKSGSMWQAVGSDNFDSLVGANPIGVVFSEWSLTNPATWDFIRPILAENGGWAMFIYTPRGNNHGKRIYDIAKKNDNWFCSRLTIDDTNAISSLAVEHERQDGMDEDMIQQEFYCSFDAALQGSYYGKLFNKLDKEGRITSVPYDPSYPVHVSWDLGIGDATALWFAQVIGSEIRLIDYYETSGVGLDHYVHVLNERGYNYADDICPHDINVRELITGTTRLETLQNHGRSVTVIKRTSIDEGIDAVRRFLPKCIFDAEKCARGLDAMRQYQKKWNEKTQAFADRPLHDWTSNAADSFRYLAQGVEIARPMDWGGDTMVSNRRPTIR